MTVPVLPSDIDEQNHVNNTVYLRWVQDVATAHWRAITSPEAQEMIGWVVLRHEIDYKTPATLGDKIALRSWQSHSAHLRTLHRDPAQARSPALVASPHPLVSHRYADRTSSSRLGRSARAIFHLTRDCLTSRSAIAFCNLMISLPRSLCRSCAKTNH